MKTGNPIICIVILFLNLSNVHASDTGKIYSFGAGVFEVDSIIMDTPHSLLEGKGRGITILKVKNGVLATAPEPVIRDLTLIGEGKNTGITLKNTWTANVENIEIENYETGMKVILDDAGHKEAGGKTYKKWPGALAEGKHWGSRVTLTDIRNVEIVGDGDGVLLDNRLPNGNNGTQGQFFTATTIWGGHIYVSGNALIVGDNVWNTMVIGTFIDVRNNGMRKNDAIIMKKKAWKLDLIGVTIDLSKKKRKVTGAEKIVAKSHRSANSVNVSLSNVKKNEIVIKKD